MPAKKKNHNVEFALLRKEVKYIQRDMAKDNKAIRSDLTEIKILLDKNYVTRVEFDPIKRLVYGVVGVILIAVVTAMLGLVIIRGL